MKAWKLVLLGTACLSLAACRTNPNLALLERELRLQEDEIYRLVDCVERAELERDSCRRENAGLRHRLESEPARDFDYPTPNTTPRPSPSPVLSPSEIVPEAIPSIHLPLENSPATQQNSDEPVGPRLSSGLEGLGGGLAGLGSPAQPLTPGQSNQVAKIELNRLLTGGYKRGKQHGHEGVFVVVEPRDAEGRVLAAPADLSIVVVDPAIPGEGGRLARWDFGAEETDTLFRASGLTRGLQIELPWPGEPPQHNDLHLFVRYATSDGRKLQADKPIRVELAGDPMPRRASDAEPGGNGPLLSGSWRTSPAPRQPDQPAAMAAQPVEPSPRIADNAAATEEPPADDRPAAKPLGASPYAPPQRPPAIKRPVWSPTRS